MNSSAVDLDKGRADQQQEKGAGKDGCPGNPGWVWVMGLNKSSEGTALEG
jgi:hypothetical protein